MAAVLPGRFESDSSRLQTLFNILFPFEIVGWSEVVESGMKPFVVVLMDVGRKDCLGFLKSPQGLSPDAFRFERFTPARGADWSQTETWGERRRPRDVVESFPPG